MIYKFQNHFSTKYSIINKTELKIMSKINDFTPIYPGIFAVDYNCVKYFRVKQDCVKGIFSIHYFNAFKSY